MEAYNICPFMFWLFHLASCFQDLSVLWRVSDPSLVTAQYNYNILLCVSVTFSYLFISCSVVSVFWLLWITLQWVLSYRYLSESLLSVSLDVYLWVESLGHVLWHVHTYTHICCCSGTKFCPTLCDPIDCSTPGSSVLHYLPEFAQIHVHYWISDAI